MLRKTPPGWDGSLAAAPLCYRFGYRVRVVGAVGCGICPDPGPGLAA
jgi:hypothetical protein